MPRRSSTRRRNTVADDAGNSQVLEPVVILNETKRKDYRLLYRAALGGHWELAESYIFPQNPEAYTAPITADSKTVLHIAVGTGTRSGNHFVKELVRKMKKASLELRDNKGETALSIAAAIGNLDAAALMIGKNHKLPYIQGENCNFPIHRAAQYVQRKMVDYLLDHVPHYEDVGGQNPYEGESGFLLLKLVISAGFYDVALKLVDRYGELLSLEYLYREDSPLALIAGKLEDFFSGTSLNLWQRWVYSCHSKGVAEALQNEQANKMTREMEMMAQSRFAGDLEETTILMQAEHQYDLNSEGDIEDGTRRGAFLGNIPWRCISAKIRELIGRLVNPMRNVHQLKLNHFQVFKLVERFCNKIDALDHKEVEKVISRPLFLATTLGIHELVETIVMELPTAIWLTDKDKRNALQVAILNRHERVFSLIYHMSHYRQLLTKHKDKFNNNILHLAGKLAPLDRLNLVPGPALQMQRELQWFKDFYNRTIKMEDVAPDSYTWHLKLLALETCVEPSYRDMKNSAGKTPWMVFVEEHKQLIKDGEKWMKETAQSCTVVASLIATVVFAAGITVPGGNDNNTGLPVFSDRKSFTVFLISNVVSLFSAIGSVLMFLSILTTRYTVNDFLYILPNKLSVGLFTLFLSVTTMLIAFSATLYLVIATRKLATLVPLLALACLTVTAFVFSQCPLLWRMLKSTYYSRNILCKKKELKFSDMYNEFW